MFYYTIGPRNKYVPLDIVIMCISYLECPGNICAKDEKTAEEVAADFLCCFEV